MSDEHSFAASTAKIIAQITSDVSTIYKIDDNPAFAIKINPKSPVDPSRITSVAVAPLSSLSSDELLPPLEVFELADVAPDPEIRDRLIEQNLDDALRYLNACTTIRSDYSLVAKSYLETRLKIEEFMLLDRTHQKEVEAGVYDLPFLEAKADYESLKKAKEHIDTQIKGIDATLEGALADTSTDQYVESAGLIAREQRIVEPAHYPQFQTWNGILARHNMTVEKATWNQNRDSALATSAQLDGHLVTANLKSEYYYKDIAFRIERRATSQQLAYAQLKEHCRNGSMLNYAERLKANQALFDNALRKLIRRVHALHGAAAALYEVNADVPSPKRGQILDLLGLWLADFQDRISKYRRRERSSVFALSLKNLLDFPRLARGESVDFRLLEKHTSGKAGLLRGVAFEYVGGPNDMAPMCLTVQAPRKVVDNVGAVPNNISSTFLFGRVMPVASSLDLRAQQSDLLWNGVPYDLWSIEAAQVPEHIRDILMYVWIAFPS